jgi:hypothetical protein
MEVAHQMEVVGADESPEHEAVEEVDLPRMEDILPVFHYPWLDDVPDRSIGQFRDGLIIHKVALVVSREMLRKFTV